MGRLGGYPEDPIQRFDARVVRTESCWLWTGASNGKYGQFRVYGDLVYVHRFAYERWVGPIPTGLTIDHLCRAKLCVNPSHLEAVTVVENSRRGALRDECPSGHPYVDDSFYVTATGVRKCRICKRAAERRWAAQGRRGYGSARYCEVNGCDSPHRARGLCASHYAKARRSLLYPEASAS